MPSHTLPRQFKGRRAFSSLGCGQLELPDAMMIAQRAAIPCIELRTLGGTVDLPTYFSSRYETPEQFAHAVTSMPAEIVSIGTSLRMVGNTPESRSAFLRYIPWADACGASTLRVFDGGATGSSEELKQIRATLQWWSALRSENGWSVDIAIETHDAFAREDNLLRLLDAEPDCKLLWDAHHTWRRGGADPVRTWSLVRNNAKHIHVKDSLANEQVTEGYAYTVPGEGEFPMSALFDVLCDADYDGILSLEWERHWHLELPPLEEALSAARRRSWW